MNALLAAGRIGETDCEAIGGGLLAQPVNALSSLAYVAVGGWLLLRATNSPPGRRAPYAVFGLTVAALGVGSLAFHGPMPAWARLVHDLTIVAVIAFIAARSAGAAAGLPDRRWLAGFGVSVALAGVVLALAPDAVFVCVGIAALAAVVAEGLRLRSGALPGPARAPVIGAASLLVVGVAANGFGRTGGPLCDPDSVAQLHAVWHVLTATALGLYGRASFRADDAFVMGAPVPREGPRN